MTWLGAGADEGDEADAPETAAAADGANGVERIAGDSTEDKEDGGRQRDGRGKTDRRRLTKQDTETETQPDKDTDTGR